MKNARGMQHVLRQNASVCLVTEKDPTTNVTTVSINKKKITSRSRSDFSPSPMHGTSTYVCRHATVDIVQRSMQVGLGLSVIGWMVRWVLDRTIIKTITIKTTMMQINKQLDLATKDVIQLTL